MKSSLRLGVSCRIVRHVSHTRWGMTRAATHTTSFQRRLMNCQCLTALVSRRIREESGRWRRRLRLQPRLDHVEWRHCGWAISLGRRRELVKHSLVSAVRVAPVAAAIVFAARGSIIDHDDGSGERMKKNCKSRCFRPSPSVI